MLHDTTDIDNQLRKTTVSTLLILAVFAVFAVGGASYFYLKIYVPIKSLTDIMNGIDSNILKAEAPISGKDELGQLGSAFNQLLKRVNQQVVEIAQTEKQRNEMEMQALQAQITPHFLYNTLNAIKCMAHLNRTEDIAKMSESLIDLLRIIASKERNIPLTRETEYVAAYCELMSLRSGNKYELDVRLSEDTKQIEVPKLTLQPIVENSIIHGKDSEHEALRIIITSCKKDGHVCIVVSDNGKGVALDMLTAINRENFVHEESNQRLRGIGLENVRSRLKMEFGEKTYVTLSINKIGGTDVTIVFPYQR